VEAERGKERGLRGNSLTSERVMYTRPHGMSLDPVTGLLRGARYVPSPNHDPRPPGAGVEVVVVHAISLPPNRFGGPEIEQFFTNRLPADAHPYFQEISDSEVSAHFLVRRDGEIVQFVPVTERAWHAGQSCCEGRTRVNDFSVGIELEGSDDVRFEDAQYDALADLTREIMRAYPAVSTARLYGHADVSPGRKTDPGPHFDWNRYRRACA